MVTKRQFVLLTYTTFAIGIWGQILPPDPSGYYSWMEADNSALLELPHSSGKNVVARFVSHDGTVVSGNTVIEYMDGLGRLSETVCMGAGGQGQDLVEYQEYDAFGREYRKWLPTVFASGAGEFQVPAQVTNASQSSNAQDAEPYSYPVYEQTALSRVSEYYGPGNDWHSHGKCVRTEYLTNVAGHASLNCQRLTFSYSSSSPAISIASQGNYPTGVLAAMKTTDEDGHVTIEFKDF